MDKKSVPHVPIFINDKVHVLLCEMHEISALVIVFFNKSFLVQNIWVIKKILTCRHTLHTSTLLSVIIRIMEKQKIIDFIQKLYQNIENNEQI